PLRTVFDVIARAGNLNFLFDKDVRADQRTTLVVRDAQVEDVIKLILATNQLEQKVLNETTALIYPNTPQKLREYQDLVVKSFYLANADVKQTANLIRTILKTRDIFVDEKINLLVMKDTPNTIRLAEKLIAAQDVADPEVMLQVEVIEVGYNKLLEVGAQISPTAAAGGGGGGGRRGRSPGAAHALRAAVARQEPGAPHLRRSPVPADTAPDRRSHQPARQPADPRAQQGESEDPHRRPRPRAHHHRRGGR